MGGLALVDQWSTFYLQLLPPLLHLSDQVWGGGTCNLLFRKEGVTQGDQLTMIVYGLIFIPLIRELQEERPHVM